MNNEPNKVTIKQDPEEPIHILVSHLETGKKRPLSSGSISIVSVMTEKPNGIPPTPPVVGG